MFWQGVPWARKETVLWIGARYEQAERGTGVGGRRPPPAWNITRFVALVNPPSLPASES